MVRELSYHHKWRFRDEIILAYPEIDSRVVNSAINFWNNANRRGARYGIERMALADIIYILKTRVLKCEYCGVDLKVYEDNHPMQQYPDALTFEHRRAMALGGKNTIENIMLCCHQCNDRKNWGETRELEELRKNGVVTLRL